MPPGQFRITKLENRNSIVTAPQDRQSFDFGDYRLEWAWPLEATFLKDGQGVLLGVALGHAFVADSGERLSSKLFTGASAATYTAAEFETLYEGLFGSFIVILSIEGRFYLYLDAGGTLSAVYSKDLERVGATAAAILSGQEYAERFRRDLYDHLDVKNEGWFPAGLTAHRGVSRLFCNHRLDLETLTVSRHWPTAAFQRSSEPGKAVETLASAVRANLKLVYDNFRAAQALTAGVDSRTLLSLARDVGAVETFTIAFGSASDLDVHVATRLARQAGVSYRILPALDEPSVGAEWRRRCGDAVGGPNAVVHTGLDWLAKGGVEAVIDGIGAEVGRCFFWKDSDSPATPIDATAITRRLGMPFAQDVADAVGHWLEALPVGGALHVLDLVQLELRFSAWAFSQSYVDPPLLHFSPFLSRRTLNAMFALPIETKRRGYGREIIRTHWPELLETPFNHWGDYRDHWRYAKRAITHPHLVTKKLRKILAP